MSDPMNVNTIVTPPQANDTTASDSSKLDPSCLHKISTLQRENQELMQIRRDLEGRLQEQEQKLLSVSESFEKERARLVEVQRKEMEEHFKAFMQEWINSMDKENPDVMARMRTGIDKLIQEGKSKDGVWEVLCCASKAHKQNVTVIEELTKTNNMLEQENKKLEDIVRQQHGFSDTGARVMKRTRLNDQSPVPGDGMVGGESTTVSSGAKFADSDVWGQFEQYMTQTTSRSVY